MTARTPDGWHIGIHDAHYLTRDGVTVAVVYSRAYIAGIEWYWWDFVDSAGHGGFADIDAAKRAAEEGTCKT